MSTRTSPAFGTRRRTELFDALIALFLDEGFAHLTLDDIAGLTNERGNVVGLMPHPEHAVEPGFGPNTPDAMRSGVDGLAFFTSAIASLAAAAA